MRAFDFSNCSTKICLMGHSKLSSKFDLEAISSILECSQIFTLTYVHRPFIKSGHLIGREVQVEVKFWPK